MSVSEHQSDMHSASCMWIQVLVIMMNALMTVLDSEFGQLTLHSLALRIICHLPTLVKISSIHVILVWNFACHFEQTTIK